MPDAIEQGTVRNVSAAPRELDGGGVVGIGEDAKDVDVNGPVVKAGLDAGHLIRIDDAPHDPAKPHNLDELPKSAQDRRAKAAAADDESSKGSKS